MLAAFSSGRMIVRHWMSPVFSTGAGSLHGTHGLLTGLAVCVLSQAVFAQAVFAQDRVTFTPPGSNGPVTEIGEILDYTGRELVLRTLNGTQHLSSASVTQIETRYEPACQQGLVAFQAQQTEEALQLFRTALQAERRPWVQREIRSSLMKCSLRMGDFSGALREFREITRTDPETRFWGIAPLVWAPTAISATVRAELEPWLTSTDVSERMLAASSLLLDPVLGEAAEGALLQLSRGTNPVLSVYSRMQLWRLSIGSRNVSETMLDGWRSDIARLRPELRSGPQYLLARGYEVQGEFRQAAAEAMWLPMIYSDHELLAARALFDASDGLARSGLVLEADVLKQELLARYPWSREASAVRSQSRQPMPTVSPGDR